MNASFVVDLVLTSVLTMAGLLGLVFARDINDTQVVRARVTDPKRIATYLLVTRLIGASLLAVGVTQMVRLIGPHF